MLRQQRLGMCFPVSQKAFVLFIAAADLHGNGTQSHSANSGEEGKCCVAFLFGR